MYIERLIYPSDNAILIQFVNLHQMILDIFNQQTSLFYYSWQITIDSNEVEVLDETYDGIHCDTLEKRYGNKSVIDEIYKSTLLPFVNSVSKRSPSKSDDSTTPVQNMYKVTCSVGLDDDFILIRAVSEIEAWNKFWEHFKDEQSKS